MRKLALAPILLLCLAATPAASLSDKPYITATDVDFPGLLPPPPTEASPAGKRDLQTILDLEKNMTPERMAAIRTDLDQSVYTIAGPVLGAKFTKANFPMVGAFIDKVEGWRRRRRPDQAEIQEAAPFPIQQGNPDAGRHRQGRGRPDLSERP